MNERRSFCHNADGTPKGVFLDKRSAKKVVRHLASRRSYQVEGRALHLYRCPDCRAYHLGHDLYDGGDAA